MKAAKQASAKSIVNADTVLSFTPRAGLFSSCWIAGTGTAAARRL
jgi:hypothetical protein